MFTADLQRMTKDYEAQLAPYPEDWRVVFIAMNLIAGYYTLTYERSTNQQIAGGISDALRQMRQDVLRVALGRVA